MNFLLESAHLPAMRALVVMVGLAGGAATPASAQQTESREGRLLVTLGTCHGVPAAPPSLSIRKVDRSERRSLSWRIFSDHQEYTNDAGRFRVMIEKLAPGEWEVYNHVIRASESSYSSKRDYSLRFSIQAGKVTDLGRLCSAMQTSADRYVDAPERLFNERVRVAYMLASATRDEDVHRALSVTGAAAADGLLRAMPARPEEVSTLIRGRPLEQILNPPIPRPDTMHQVVPVR